MKNSRSLRTFSASLVMWNVSLACAQSPASAKSGCDLQICTGGGDTNFFDDHTVTMWARGNLISEDPVPVFHNTCPIDCQDTLELDLFDGIEISDQVPGAGSFPLTWADLIGIAYFRATYQKDDGTTGELGTSIVGAPAFRMPGNFRFVPSIKLAEVETGLPESERISVTLTGNFEPEASIISKRTYPDPMIGSTASELVVQFHALQDIVLDGSLHANDAFRFVTLSSMFSSDTVYDANVLRWIDPGGAVHVLRLNNGTRRDSHLLPPEMEIGNWFELVKEPDSDWSPSSPTIRVDIIDRGKMTGSLGIQGFLATDMDPNADSFTAWVEWLDVPNPVPTGTTEILAFRVSATPPRVVFDTCLADLDGSGDVRVPDLIILLGAWGANPGHPADFDGDGQVRVPDLIVLLGTWGACP